MRLPTCTYVPIFAVAAMVLSACNVEVIHHVRPSADYVSPQQQWQELPDTLLLNRRQITAGAVAPGYITGRFFHPHNWRGGMCYDQYWEGRRVFMCTTRAYLDRQLPVSKRLAAHKLPPGVCGTVAPVYYVGYFSGCAHFSGTVKKVYRYQGVPQYHHPYRRY